MYRSDFARISVRLRAASPSRCYRTTVWPRLFIAKSRKGESAKNREDEGYWRRAKPPLEMRRRFLGFAISYFRDFAMGRDAFHCHACRRRQLGSHSSADPEAPTSAGKARRIPQKCSAR
ncbi:MAG: hypothetical protein DCC68_05680 [Planctomycetota bacterium]|nr:MAG: hypothetical protein DCC68_05680 [Planctomycetota bacterium]